MIFFKCCSVGCEDWQILCHWTQLAWQLVSQRETDLNYCMNTCPAWHTPSCVYPTLHSDSRQNSHWSDPSCRHQLLQGHSEQKCSLVFICAVTSSMQPTMNADHEWNPQWSISWLVFLWGELRQRVDGAGHHPVYNSWHAVLWANFKVIPVWDSSLSVMSTRG